jgi:1-acyl-sn-glycerol-3-phosphate acyltransferase
VSSSHAKPLHWRIDRHQGPGYRSGWYRFAAGVLRPILFAITKRDWQGWEYIPQSGGVIVATNHTSYADPFVFAHYLFDSGRSPRFIGKAEVFRIPFFGRLLLGAGQIPVQRESAQAREAMANAIDAVNFGELLAIYPEGTLTHDPDMWPMVAKTGVARIALATGAPVIPVAQWGSHKIIPLYGFGLHLWPRTQVHVHAGPPVDLSAWQGRDDQEALIGATAAIMKAITALLADIRGEEPPTEPYDPRTQNDQRTGNFKKRSRTKKGQS